MLVLSRKTNESVVAEAYDENGNRVQLEIKIVGVRGDKVRLGISAPSEIPIHREEVFAAIQKNGSTRASSSSCIVEVKASA